MGHPNPVDVVTHEVPRTDAPTVGVCYRRQAICTFVCLIRMVAQEIQGFILVRAPRGPYVQFDNVFFMLRGLVVGVTSLGRQRNLILSLRGVVGMKCSTI
jgi:hypothetical protein